ncbi:MAG: hypothetical protein R2774_00525 [Saprospiraceae bacterium]
MRLSILEKREDVLEILVKSLNNFWLDQKSKIKANSKPFNRSGITFYGNKYLNFFASKHCDKNNFDVIKKEYANAIVWWRKPLQKFYVWTFTKPIIYRFFHHYEIQLSGNVTNIEKSWLIMGGNTRIRVINSINNETLVILKSNSGTSFIESEIYWKSKIKSSVIPNLIKTSLNFFSEELTPGIPINRYKEEMANKYRLKTYATLYEDVFLIHSFFSTNYAVDLIKSIANKLKRESIFAIDYRAKDLAAFFVGYKVICSVSHGDLQDANIIKTKSQCKVIDWESVKIRSIIYDYVTLFSKTRESLREKKVIINSIKDYLNNFRAQEEEEIQINDYYILFLLEELDYRLDYYSLNIRATNSDMNYLLKLIFLINKEIDR